MKLTVCIALVVIGLGAILTVPIPKLDLDYSKVVYDQSGHLLSAKIAKDEQWRFPAKDTIPQSFETCILNFEDAWFYYHPGINPVSMFKAVLANRRAGKIVRGGSTLTMQLMRMYRGNRNRTYGQKFIEILGALKLELLYSKRHILQLWTAMAPFGGNTVGATTASWRYFDRELEQLSWSEYATLAVLPNTPAKIHMTKNVEALKVKRDRLLHKLYEKGFIDHIELTLALDEDINFNQSAVPQLAIHFLENVSTEHPENHEFHSTIDISLQATVTQTLQEFSDLYQHDGIQNASAVVIDIVENELKAYVGNTLYKANEQRYVDCVQAPRSYGSLLKPFLYAYAVDNGYFLPYEHIKDVPSNFHGFVPKNFDKKFRGVVSMDEMVSQSYNVAAVRILNFVGLESFHSLLRSKLGLQHLHHDPHHHGLSLILGGGEASMWDLARLYKGLTRNHYQFDNAYAEVSYLKDQDSKSDATPFAFHPQAVWHSLSAMMSVNRPKEEQHFVKLGGREIAWKTGTSYGHRDAWAIGTNGRYVVAVWIGNEAGNGVYNLTGAKKAGPVLFKLFRFLSSDLQLEDRYVQAEEVKYCRQSGMLKSHLCTDIQECFVPRITHILRTCNRHQVVTSSTQALDTVYFLPPRENHYYQAYYGTGHSLPKEVVNSSNFTIIYPEINTVITVPKNIEGKYSSVALKASSLSDDSELYWFLNGEFLKKTDGRHEISADLTAGNHELVINNRHGHVERRSFMVVRGSE